MAMYSLKGNTAITILIALSIVSTIVTIAYGCSTIELEKKNGDEGKKDAKKGGKIISYFD